MSKRKAFSVVVVVEVLADSAEEAETRIDDALWEGNRDEAHVQTWECQTENAQAYETEVDDEF